MKIGIVTPYAYPLPGGVNDHVGSLYRVLRSRGHDVRIITSSHGLQKASEGDIIRVGKGFSVPFNGSMGTITLSPTYLAQMRAILERERFDVLHYHEPFVPFLSLVTLTLSTSVNVGTFHAFGGLSISYEFGKRMLGHYAGKLHGRIAVSPAARHFISRYFPGEYKIVPNGVEPGRYQRAVPIARYRDGVPNILFVGRMEPRKGLIHLLRAFRKLQRDGVRARLLLVGTGPGEREARRYVLTRQLDDVEFLGRVSEAQKAQLFKTADIYVSPATGRESFGIVLLEAMSAGAPIICSDIHGYRGVVRRERDGILVEPGNADALAASIRRLIDDPALRAQLSRAGEERAQLFTWERVGQAVEEYYGFVIRRLAEQGELPKGFSAPIPPPPGPRVRTAGER
ncbi:MAG: glycosyltransferase family 4 protein [bacterium Ellin6529]|jgi:phosphatidyl-myo-inositol alpha-mannosyltransferase|uniref:glycosyltransferase family 4 protein n=1 Tax=Candidatus Limnocylindrus sp. TaxID=2802978 RepID=UPI00278E8B62|nr:glycosyltransferase family 4 protein [bacterium Ellin6529]